MVGKRKYKDTTDAHTDDKLPMKRTRKASKKMEDLNKDVDEVDEEKTSSSEPEIEWTAELSFSLLTRITECEITKNRLYPGPGANVSTAKGGGLPKIEHHFRLFNALFGEDPAWQQLLQTAKDQLPGNKSAAASTQKLLSGKIKNRLSKMATQTRNLTAAMGKTGQGLSSVDDIDMTQKNHLTDLWGKHCEKTPWYFEMRDLIAEHPNAKPISIGNAQSTVDMSILDSQGPSDHDTEGPTPGEETEREKFTSMPSTSNNERDASLNADDDDDEPYPHKKSYTRSTASDTKPVKASSAPKPNMLRPVETKDVKNHQRWMSSQKLRRRKKGRNKRSYVRFNI
ncbi:hypothetical protein BDP27DRAFT_1435253 [Rhodocollybia butyracea]|uniref:Uncharacterized protein n=1 Tax=Rhodocollybia butyracea TaxID=206335 RepID=A0A9P5P6J1_9AGAR|nr:hypothetical protein BDP27DRAFT_1435253 [Rhodocollybia butyracea]